MMRPDSTRYMHMNNYMGLEDQSPHRLAQEQRVVIPSKTADWFDADSIAQIEKDSLPEFFTSLYPSKTPQIYKEYRTFII